MNTLFNTFNASLFQTYPMLDSDALVPSLVQYPFYHVSRASVVPGVNDKALSLIAPILSYWVYSLFFHVLDLDVFQWSAKHRLHESEEIKSKNLASRKDVVLAVVLQQVIQTLLGVVWLDGSEGNTFQQHTVEMRQLGKWLAPLTVTVLGEARGMAFLTTNGQAMLSWMYWWGIPIVQFLSAMCVLYSRPCICFA